jgi:ParB family chromosome partitioning protein
MIRGVSKPSVLPRNRRRRAQTATIDGPAPELRWIPLDVIDLPSRPARRFLDNIDSLAQSMQDYGLQQPISVRANAERYTLTSGLRRLTAAQTLGWTTILAFVRSVSVDDAYLVDLIENLQREDLSPEEEADALGELIRTRGWTLQQVATGVKRSVAYVSKRVRIFEDPFLREAVVNRGLAVSTAEEVLAADRELRPMLIERAVVERWDQQRVRDALRNSDTLQRMLDAPQAQKALPEGESGPKRGLPKEPTDRSLSRPRGFTSSVRTFHRLLSTVQAEDLTGADRAALRALFRDLVMLARASTTSSARVFPPLPSGNQPRRAHSS